MESIVIILFVIIASAASAFGLYLAMRKPTQSEAELKGALQMLITTTGTQLATMSKEFEQRGTRFQQAVDQRIEALQRGWQDQSRESPWV